MSVQDLPSPPLQVIPMEETLSGSAFREGKPVVVQERVSEVPGVFLGPLYW